MEQILICGLFIRVLSKDVIGVIRSFMSIRPLLATHLVSGCRAQKLAMDEGAYEDKSCGLYFLPKSQINIPKDHEKGRLFIRQLQWGCGTCGPCQRVEFLKHTSWRTYVPCVGCENAVCNNPDHVI